MDAAADALLFEVSDRHGRMYRRYALWIFCSRIHVRTTLDQLAGKRRMPEKDCQPNRRVTIFGVLVQQRGVAVEQRDRALSIADRARLRKRQLCATLRK